MLFRSQGSTCLSLSRVLGLKACMCTPDLASLLRCCCCCCCCFQHCLGKYKRQESTGDLSSPSDTPSLVLLGQQFFSLLVVFSSFVLLVFPFKKNDLFVFHVHCLFEGVGCPGTGVTDSCETSHGCWELSSAPLNDRPTDSSPTQFPFPAITAPAFLQSRPTHMDPGTHPSQRTGHNLRERQAPSNPSSKPH